MPQFRISIDRRRDEPTNRPNFGGGNFYPPALNPEQNTKYHNDDAFTNVSLNLLARYEQLNLTATESIQATLASHEERSAFYEALCFQKSQISQMGAYSASSMLQKIDEAFGAELKSMCMPHHQAAGPTTHEHVPAPMTPRNDRNPATANSFHHFLNPRGVRQQQAQPRCFFPDSGPRSSRYLMQKKVQNIDWQLAQAVQQVVSLSLDGPAAKTETPSFARYEPPSPMPYRTG